MQPSSPPPLHHQHIINTTDADAASAAGGDAIEGSDRLHRRRSTTTTTTTGVESCSDDHDALLCSQRRTFLGEVAHSKRFLGSEEFYGNGHLKEAAVEYAVMVPDSFAVVDHRFNHNHRM